MPEKMDSDHYNRWALTKTCYEMIEFLRDALRSDDPEIDRSLMGLHRRLVESNLDMSPQGVLERREHLRTHYWLGISPDFVRPPKSKDD